MTQSKVDFIIEELRRGNMEAAQLIEPMYDLIELENAEAYERSMQPFPRPLRLIFAVEAYMAEVYNGGHEQFFFNSSGVVWQDALEGLKVIGAVNAAAILERAVSKMKHPIPDDTAERRAMMDELEEELFEEDDDALYALDMDLPELEKEFVRRNAAELVQEGLLVELRYYFQKCSDCSLHPAYKQRLELLTDLPLTQGLVDYLCEKATSTKHWPELRFAHLRILLLNESSRSFDLKQWYLDGWKRSRRLWLRLYFVRGYASYATEGEMQPVMKRFGELLHKSHDYVDYADILSCAGLPYLAEQYGYPCVLDALETAKAECEKIDPLLRNRWTTNERLEHVDLVSGWEAFAREKAYLAKIGAETAEETHGAINGISQDVIALKPDRKYNVTVECTIQQSAFPTVPTLSLPEGAEGYIMLDVDRYSGIPGLSARKSTKLSARMKPKAPGYFLVESDAGELCISFQGWVPSANGQGEWKESTALPALVMKREQLAPNKIRYGCTAAMEPRFNCFVFTVEWKEVQP